MTFHGGPDAVCRVAKDADDAGILARIDEFVALLAAEKWSEAACFMRSQYPTSPELLAELVRTHDGYRSDDPTARVDDPAAVFASADPADFRSVEWFDDSRDSGGSVHYDLPIEGERSDLTLTVQIHVDGEHLELVFESIHVL